MEVHHHSHSSRKKWTHYFWEFLMLFLAVFCGFLAENKREHMIEHQREKKYMKSLFSDLQSDSASLQNNIKYLNYNLKGLDTLILALRQPLTVKRNLDFVYIIYLKYGQSGTTTAFNENTSTQLKNAGALRLIRKEEVVKTINQYEKAKVEALKQSDDCWQFLINFENQQANYLFDLSGTAKILKVIEASVVDNTDSLMQVAANDSLGLIDNNPGRIVVFRNGVRSSHSLQTNYLSKLEKAVLFNRQLIALLKKEYHIKEIQP